MPLLGVKTPKIFSRFARKFCEFLHLTAAVLWKLWALRAKFFEVSTPNIGKFSRANWEFPKFGVGGFSNFSPAAKFGGGVLKTFACGAIRMGGG